jgi:biotin carboxyl carrier protein
MIQENLHAEIKIKWKKVMDFFESRFDRKPDLNAILFIIGVRELGQLPETKFSKEEKTASIKVNGHTYNIAIKDRFDDLLHQLGLDNLQSAKVAELKAPMPGLVLSILVKEGDEIKKGDNLLVLEAMKMENIIKSPADVTIKSIKIKPSDKVEKNQVLIQFS